MGPSNQASKTYITKKVALVQSNLFRSEISMKEESQIKITTILYALLTEES